MKQLCAIVLLLSLNACALPIIGGVIGAGSATYSATERDDMEKRLKVLEAWRESGKCYRCEEVK
jgi:hypothetical protein